MPKQVTIYTIRTCPHCMRAKQLLKAKAVPFKEVDVTEDENKRTEIERQTGWMTVPMIFIGEEFIGGADELARLANSGGLDSKLK